MFSQIALPLALFEDGYGFRRLAIKAEGIAIEELRCALRFIENDASASPNT